VNADDFGMTRGINRAIVEASQQGIVTSTTLMATAHAFGDAVTQSQSVAPRVSIGCHVILLDGTPALPPYQVPSLLQPRGSAGEFRVKLNDFAKDALTDKLAANEVEAEAVAQVRKLQSAGIDVSHFDCHKHAHMFPSVLKPLLRAANACDVRAVRNPFGPLLPLPLAHIVRTPATWPRVTQLAVLRTFSARFGREVANFGLRTTDGSVGVIDTGTLDLKSFLLVVESLPEGTWEFVCHPGYNDTDLDQVRTRLRQSRQTELAVLTSSEARCALERRGIELISYRDL